jgi:nucleotide-binding universal stress UspA family protein
MKTIVVGVDGSQPSLHALRWAVDEARLRSAKVVAVLAWSLPAVSTTHEALHVLSVDFEETARGALGRSVQRVAPHVGVEIEELVSEGPAAAALLAVADDADMLVVGSRGLGGFKGLLLGSVSQQVTQHALCPVVVIRTPEDAPASASLVPAGVVESSRG